MVGVCKGLVRALWGLMIKEMSGYDAGVTGIWLGVSWGMVRVSWGTVGYGGGFVSVVV